MSLKHLYEGRFNKERQTKTYSLGVYLSYEATIDAEDADMAKEAFEEEVREIQRGAPGVEVVEYYQCGA